MIPRVLTILVPVATTLVFGAWGTILGPLLPDIAAEFGKPVEIVGLLIACSFAGSLVSVILGGVLADRFGKKRVFLITLSAFLAAIVLLVSSHSFPIIAVAYLLGGAMGSVLEGLCGALVADFDPARGDRNQNLLQVGFSTGAVVALVITGVLRGAGSSWRTIYEALCFIIAGILLCALAMRPPAPHPGAPISPPIIRRVASNPLILLLALAIALYVGAELSLAYWISPIMETSGAGYSKFVAVLSPALFWGMTGVGRLISGLVCRRTGGLRVLRWLLIGGLLSFVVLLAPLGPWRLWVGVGLAGLAFSGVWPLIISLGSAHYPAYSGTTVALLVAAGTVGGMLFPPLAGFALTRAGVPVGFAVMAGLFVLLTAVVAAYARRHARLSGDASTAISSCLRPG